MISTSSRGLIVFVVAASTVIVLIEWHAVHHIGLAHDEGVGRGPGPLRALRALAEHKAAAVTAPPQEIEEEAATLKKNSSGVLSALRARAFGRKPAPPGGVERNASRLLPATTLRVTTTGVRTKAQRLRGKGSKPPDVVQGTQAPLPLQTRPPTVPPLVVNVSFPPPPEVRHFNCRNRPWDTSKLPTVAMVIPYLNETWVHISSTVASILAYTPMDVLTEILFIDDGNSEGWKFHAELQALHPKVRVHRNEKRQGLIRAKVIGAHLTDSDVLMFMEPHCVVGREWLQPLLATMVQGGHRTVVMPTLDIIPEENFAEYRPANYHIGGFDWSMTFNWMAVITERNSSYRVPEAFPTPALSGGIFAIWRDFWHESGEYDVNMTEWGGEHIEMSLRTWRCGGQIFAVPCSRIGHVFRQRNPYIVHQKEVIKNQKRAAYVWLDEHLEDFYKEVPYARHLDAGDMTERLKLKEKLQCKSMEWYVDNVYPELKGKQPRKR
mmetsp:Transcript_11035/g.25247  ORF Transcript_11035/g.25247 Transcript_11035/m.25247 type:complete len:493 (-) Transcript_11035:178-1656(-)